MAIFNWTTSGASTKANYEALCWEIIKDAEGFGVTGHPGELYYDSKGILTNGFGFNLSIPAVLEEVLKAMGLDKDADGITSQETNFINQIRQTISSYATGGAAGYAGSLQNAINDLMAQRMEYYNNEPENAWRPDILQDVFVFLEKDDAKSVFDVVAFHPSGRFAGVLDSEETYEQRVVTWTQGMTNIAPYSRERAVLFSLAYNGALNASDNLKAAIEEGGKLGRVKAWLEIRYYTNPATKNGQPVPLETREGLSKRRYYESELFGFYDSNQTYTLQDAEAIFDLIRTYNEGMSRILSYDAQFGTYVGDATSDYGYTVSTFDQTLERLADLVCANPSIIADPALFDLFAIQDVGGLDVRVGDSESITGETFTLSTHLNELGTDYAHGKVIGGGGDDTINGSDGRNHLEGEKGNDTIYGNGGNDYILGDRIDLEWDLYTESDYADASQWGDDLIEGGEGRDWIHGQGGDDELHGGEGDDGLLGDWGSYIAEIEEAQGGQDVIYGDAGDDIILGNGKDDILRGGDDNDEIYGDYGRALGELPEVVYNEGNMYRMYGMPREAWMPGMADILYACSM